MGNCGEQNTQHMSRILALMSTPSRTLRVILEPFLHMLQVAPMCTTLTPHVQPFHRDVTNGTQLAYLRTIATVPALKKNKNKQAESGPARKE